jgi:PAS domain S-box-containing protein
MTAATDNSDQLERTLEHRKLELVMRTGMLLNQSHDLESIVQAATDAGLQISGAQFGAFFYNVINAEGERYLLYTLSGASPERFDAFPMPRNTAIFGPTFHGEAIVRSGDITKDPRYGHNAPYFGMPQGHLPVRSYLAVPVKAQSGEVLGALFYGHDQPDVFSPESETLLAAIAAQAAVAIENAGLREQLHQKMGDLDCAHSIYHSLYNGASKRLGEFAAIIESSDDAIISKDLTGRITSWNPAATRILGYTSEEMIGASILTIIPPELQADETMILARIRAGQRIDHFETIRLNKDGRRLDVSLSISPVRDNSGQIVGAAKILRDISTRKALELSLLQAEKLATAGRMAATIAHEINNPLEAVVNLLYLARLHATDPVQAEYLAAAESEVARVSHIARQTLGYYRDPTSVITTSLSDIAAEIIRIYEPRLKATGIRVESHLDPSPDIALRKGEIMQVLSNLITNAIYAMPSGGTLSVAVQRVPDGVVICVQDTGVGIPPDQLPRIFDAFYTTRTNVGTGIGLFVAKQFVEGHGGRIEVESHTSSNGAKPSGTKMCIFLPLQSQYAAA